MNRPAGLRLSRTILLAALGVALGCGERSGQRIEIAPDSRTPSPTLVFAGDSVPRLITVERVGDTRGAAGGARAWTLMRDPRTSAPTMPLRLTYGTVPGGFVSVAPAAVLYPGTYRAHAIGVGHWPNQPFKVRTDGRVEIAVF